MTLHVKDALDLMLADMKRKPLVTRSGNEYTFHDRESPSFDYEFDCESYESGLDWIRHMSEKNWVTTEHIHDFSSLLIERLSKGRCP